MSDLSNNDHTECTPEEHPALTVTKASAAAITQAVRLFKALGDEARLRTLELLMEREACVSELAEAGGEQVSTVSHRLRLLHTEGLVERRRQGRHIYYSLADSHVIERVRNALDHAEHHPSIHGTTP